MGDMRIDQQSRRDILCVAGGTGLAPDQGDRRRHGALEHRPQRHAVLRRPPGRRPLRHGRRCTAWPRMNRWLTVVPACRTTRSFNGEQGLLPDVVARHGRWGDHDVFVCGSPAMTRATVGRLMTLGVPADRLALRRRPTASTRPPPR